MEIHSMEDITSSSQQTEKSTAKHKPERDVERSSLSSISAGQLNETQNDQTHRGLKSRHAQMIALGGTIGTGLFVGAGQGLSIGGPLFLLLAYCTITFLLYGVATATGEMSAYLPVPGCSVAYYGNRFFSSSMGFALGWMYWYIFSITVAAEITAATLVIEYWNPPVHTAVWLTIIGIVIVACNAFPVQVYGEMEFWFASTKVIAILGLIIMAICLFFGGGPSHEPLYFSFWADPGPMNEYLVGGATGRFCAFLGTLVFSVYAFAFAPELLVVTGGEMDSPRRNLPTATKRYFWRLIIFYVMGAIAIGVIVPSDNPSLLSDGAGSAASPWAAGIRRAGIPALDSIVNAMILLSAWSAGNSYLYLASRGLYSLAVSDNAPAIFARCTKSGVPTYATLASAAISVLAYLNLGSTSATVFNWFVNLINTGGFQSWICCCIVYFRFRAATDAQQVTDIPYRSRFQPYTAWISCIAFSILLLVNGFKVFFAGHWNTSTFMTSYIGIAIFFALYLGHKIFRAWHEPWMIPATEVDLHTGLDEVLSAETPAPPKRKWNEKWRAIYE